MAREYDRCVVVVHPNIRREHNISADPTSATRIWILTTVSRHSPISLRILVDGCRPSWRSQPRTLVPRLPRTNPHPSHTYPHAITMGPRPGSDVWKTLWNTPSGDGNNAAEGYFPSKIRLCTIL